MTLPPPSNAGKQSTVWLFPTYAYSNASGHWTAVVGGAVFRPQAPKLRKRLLLQILRRVMKAPRREFQSEAFLDRIGPFVAAPHRGRRLAFRVGSTILPAPQKSRRNGHFEAALRVTLEQAEDAIDRWIEVHPIIPGAAGKGGRVCLLEPTGVSIVSDIDDTIKFTDVGNRRRMLQNTFLRPFATIEGMAPRYRQWAAENAAFHYVSSSPWQLFAPLEQWRCEAGFPEGTFHLRQLRLGAHMLRRLLRIRRHGKARVIHDLLERFPQRQFVLIGDSGERDPEIYGALARRFPHVSAIWIRQLAHRPMGAERLGKAFRELDSSRCKVFERAAELPLELAEFCGAPVAV